MAGKNTPDAFVRIVESFTTNARSAFITCLAKYASQLEPDEATLIRIVAEEALCANARLKLNRVLLLELHAAERSGQLTATDDTSRFAEFVELALRPNFVEHLDHRYPSLRQRFYRAIDQQCNAIELLLTRFVADRAALADLLGRPSGRLTAIALGQGDLHAGGQTVARLSLEGGEVLYKPRSLRIDIVLETFLATVFGDAPDRIRVPAVIDRGDYGWSAFVNHRYCENDDELQTFYGGLGHWLAILRLLGGADIHMENLIAAGPVPTVIDVESLFVAIPTPKPSGCGQAYDIAQSLIRNSVLRTGIVPFRTQGLGFDGVDLSAAGALPDQQPQIQVPVIVDEGTTKARVQITSTDVTSSQNHPAPRPDLSRHWGDISNAFLATTEHLRQLDAQDKIVPLLAAFEHCKVRTIRRATQTYVEIARMLWHPASLHNEEKAIERARDLFTRSAAVVPIAPSLPQEIASEIDDLRYGDVPIFVAPLTHAQIEATLQDWRGMRVDLEEMTIRSALVATELNHRVHEPNQRDGRFYFARHPHADRLEERRRKLAAETVERLLQLAVRADDDSATWITPEISSNGWLVQPLQASVYFGLGGVAIALAGYQHEVDNGRADTVHGLAEAFEGALRSLQSLMMANSPANVGGFNGSGARIWTWLTLYDLLQRPELIAYAIASAETLEEKGFDGDRGFDIIDGSSGAIVPLLALAEATGDARWLALAARAGRQLERTALVDERGTRWPTILSEPIGGFAHGAMGIAWALARLTLTNAGDQNDRARWHTLADDAFTFQDSLYDERLGNWLDLRQRSREENFHTWCNGSVGIGLAASDIYARTREPRHLYTLRRAVMASQNHWGISHTLCHGDFSLHELLVRAAALDPAGCPTDSQEATAQVVSSIEEHHGIVGGMTRAAFTPGLMTGLAGAIHGLNRMHPDCTLASPLLLERRSYAETRLSTKTTTSS